VEDILKVSLWQRRLIMLNEGTGGANASLGLIKLKPPLAAAGPNFSGSRGSRDFLINIIMI
jgi:hypothetical protein